MISIYKKAVAKTFTVLVVLTLVVNFSFSQGAPSEVNSHAGVNVVPPSPTASAIAKYGNFPVNMANGVANVSIPIHALQGDGISVPISLSYHGSGVKLDDVSSWVGLGWTLNAGGVVSRTVMGAPDELLPGGYMYTGTTIEYPYNPSSAGYAIIATHKMYYCIVN